MRLFRGRIVKSRELGVGGSSSGDQAGTTVDQPGRGVRAARTRAATDMSLRLRDAWSPDKCFDCGVSRRLANSEDN